jgi:hypothetical protein
MTSRPAGFMLSVGHSNDDGASVYVLVRGVGRRKSAGDERQDQQNVRKLTFSTVGNAKSVVDLNRSQLLCSFSRSQDLMLRAVCFWSVS